MRGLADTSVVIDWDDPLVSGSLPDQVAVSTISLAELTTGPHLARGDADRASRQVRLRRIESQFEMLPFDVEAARSYGLLVAAVTATGRSHRSRLMDLLIAAVAHANGLPLYTRNPQDFVGLEHVLTVVAI